MNTPTSLQTLEAAKNPVTIMFAEAIVSNWYQDGGCGRDYCRYCHESQYGDEDAHDAGCEVLYAEYILLIHKGKSK